MGIRPDFFYRTGKPLVDRAVHQSVSEPEHNDDRQYGQQQSDYHHAGAELGSQYTQTTLGKQFQQIAR